MIPGMGKMNPKQMQNMMKQMGIQSKPINATQVVIKTEEGKLVIDNPQVTQVKMKGMTTYQVMGEASEQPSQPYSEEDVKMVAEKTGCSKKEAGKALEKTEGDIAEAILKIQEE